MIFGATATHALRALAHLAAREEAPALGRDLAREVGVPADYLAKVLATLARAGVLTATRGAGGGYRLARPASEIRLVEILEPIAGSRVRPGCLLRPDQPCTDEARCPAHGSWAEAKGALEAFLERTTLADIQGGARPGRGAPRRSTRKYRATPKPQRRRRTR